MFVGYPLLPDPTFYHNQNFAEIQSLHRSQKNRNLNGAIPQNSYFFAKTFNGGSF
jgi:hypothetical protein